MEINEGCNEKVLTIAVPSYNMEHHLPKNLPTYADSRFGDALEVIILDNASTDQTAKIAQDFVTKYPQIFRLVGRESRGYGSSINEAIQLASGRYFRIVDADDWVNKENLLQLIDKLRTCQADVVQTNYRKVSMTTKQEFPVRFQNIDYDHLYSDFSKCRLNAPCIHSTTYQTQLLRDNEITLQDQMFFVDEEYVTLPFLYAQNVIFYDLDIYRYLVGNPTQSTSPKNRAKYADHREKIVRRLIHVYQSAQMNDDVRAYCFFRISQAAADHLTTLYMYLPDRKEGKKRALEWENEVRTEDAQMGRAIRKKAFLLRQLNGMHVGLEQYERLKKLLLRK